MATNNPIKVTRWTGEARFFETEAEAVRFIAREGDQSRLWKIER